MTGHRPRADQSPDSNDPFGVSKFSPRRNTVQIILCLALIIGLLAWTTIHAARTGSPTTTLIPAAALAAALVMIIILVRVSIRTVQGEIWIRRMGMGDLEYRVEPTGNDEITKALEALETLRQSSLRAIQLDQVRLLSQELQEKNVELESALETLRKTQDRIISQQKLAELGELSAGVAHEMRNPLQFIKNFSISSNLLIRELEPLLEQPDEASREEARELIQEISGNLERVNHHSERANGIVSGMLTLDRGSGRGFRPVNLNQLAAEQTNRAHQAVQVHEPGFSAQVTMEADPDLGEITLVPEDVARVIANLVTNACQAMAEKARGAGGNYTPELLVRTSGTGDGVTITVRDNGPGVTPEIERKMFNPFFTTRDTGRNTGLGLSLAHDIAREHGGDIEVRSEPGEYTEMRVFLPDGPPPQREPGPDGAGRRGALSRRRGEQHYPGIP